MKVEASEHPFPLLKRPLGYSAVVGRGRSVRATLFPSLAFPAIHHIASHATKSSSESFCTNCGRLGI